MTTFQASATGQGFDAFGSGPFGFLVLEIAAPTADATAGGIERLTAATQSVLDNVAPKLDVAISTRAAPNDLPPPPDNTSIAGILTAIDARLDAAVSTRSTLTAADVWSVTTRTLTESLGLTSAQAAQLDGVFAVLGLDPARPVEITDTSRKAGAIDQTITDDGTTTTVQAS